MKDEKVLVNFRITKERKRQLEYLAEKRGVSTTQFLDLLISDTISNHLKNEGMSDAIEQAILSLGLDSCIAKNFRTVNELENLKKIMSAEKYSQLLEVFMKFIKPCTEKYFNEFGLKEPDMELENILKESE